METIVFQLCLQTFRLGVEATDRQGSRDGLTGSIQLEIYVLDNSYQLTMVLSNGVERVTQVFFSNPPKNPSE